MAFSEEEEEEGEPCKHGRYGLCVFCNPEAYEDEFTTRRLIFTTKPSSFVSKGRKGPIPVSTRDCQAGDEDAREMRKRTGGRGGW